MMKLFFKNTITKMKSLFKVSLVMLAFAGFMLHSGSVNAQSTCNVPEKYCVINTSDDGNIGSASDTNAIAIAAAGVVGLSAATEASATGTAGLTWSWL